MKTVHNFHRKRPHILPPLPNFQPSEFRPMDPLQPPDLLLTESRLGSPAPRRNDPRESDYIANINNGKPIIRIIEENESEKCNLKIDLLSDPLFKEENYLLQLKKKKINMCELECDKEGGNMKNFTIFQQPDYFRDDLHKRMKSHSVLPLKDLKTVSESKVPPIPSRYTPLKPITKDRNEN